MSEEGANTEFVYLYRDADNYKRWGRVVFEGAFDESDEEAIRAACDMEAFFVAAEVRVPEVFLYAEDGESRTAADHGWHEFWEVRLTDEPSDDACGRSVADFVVEFSATCG